MVHGVPTLKFKGKKQGTQLLYIAIYIIIFRVSVLSCSHAKLPILSR